MYYETNNYDELYHHGVKGMRWGVRHDRKSSGRRRNSRDGSKSKSSQNKVFNKRNLKIAAGVVGAGVGAYVGYKLVKNLDVKPSDFQRLEHLSGDASIGDIGQPNNKSHSKSQQSVGNGLKIHKRYMTEQERFATVCPKGKTPAYRNCCVHAAIAGYLAETLNIDCEALPTDQIKQIAEGVVEKVFDGKIDRTVMRSASGNTFGCSESFEKCQENFARWFGPNSGGILSMDYDFGGTGSYGGHCITWKMRDGKLHLSDYKEGTKHEEIISTYFNASNPNGQFTAVNLDKLSPNYQMLVDEGVIKPH